MYKLKLARSWILASLTVILLLISIINSTIQSSNLSQSIEESSPPQVSYQSAEMISGSFIAEPIPHVPTTTVEPDPGPEITLHSAHREFYITDISDPVSTNTISSNSIKKEKSKIKVKTTQYVTISLNVRKKPNPHSKILGQLAYAEKVKVTSDPESNGFVQIKYDGGVAYVQSRYLSDEEPKPAKIVILSASHSTSKSKETTSTTTDLTTNSSYNGEVLTKQKGAIQGPSGKETYYNLKMDRVVENMRKNGYEGEYWVREDGCKMFGDYIIIAANLSLRPRGSLVSRRKNRRS